MNLKNPKNNKGMFGLESWFFSDNTMEEPMVQLIDMVRDIRAILMLILLVLIALPMFL